MSGSSPLTWGTGIVLLEVAGLTTHYGGLVALDNASIRVASGEIVVVAGANGAGKSTLLKSIAGLEVPRAGSVTFDGQNIARMKAHQVTLLGIACVPESKRLFPRLSVRENLRLGSFPHRKRADREAPLEQIFHLFPRLAERLEQKAATLSGGEQQMLAIGRALMTRPRLLMLDEPSQGIMPRLVDEIFQAVRTICAGGVSVLLVEQRLMESLEIADRVYVLQTGRVILSGTSEDVRDNPALRAAYMGM